ncbi:hypothetical protein HGRIS_000800 [Hohenbuehelia grisea]|uniref:Uncharacterized protein n=1 Tax=Hohenbuehelia grisea TaxID=104357 RepID=A0ABR3IPS9_9AGAR
MQRWFGWRRLFRFQDSLDSSIPLSYSTIQASATGTPDNILAKGEDHVSLPAPPVVDLAAPPRESSIVAQIHGRELSIHLENPVKVDQDFHSSELEKLERLCEASSFDIELLVVEAQHIPEDVEYATKLFNEALRAALSFAGSLRDVKLILPSTTSPVPTDQYQTSARVFPWWHLPKHGLSTVTNLTIKYSIPIDECIELLSLCPDLRQLHVESIAEPIQAGPLKRHKVMQLTKLRSMKIRTTVDLAEFFRIVVVHYLWALDMELAGQASPHLYEIPWRNLKTARVIGIPNIQSERDIRSRLRSNADIQISLAID